MDAYSVTLALHSLLRWAVLGLLVAVLVRAARKAPWAPSDDGLHVAAVAAFDLQLLLGLVLYVGLSPITTAFFGAPGPSMRDSTLRFFGVEHLTSMILALVAMHVGRVRGKRAPAADKKKTVLRWTAAALIFCVIGVPWPFLRYGRPLARGLGSDAAVVSTSCPPSYASRCAACHGAAGRGDGAAAVTLTPRPRDFSDASWGASRTDDELASIVHDGGGAHGLSVGMPPHSDLSPEELAELVACLRSFAAAPTP